MCGKRKSWSSNWANDSILYLDNFISEHRDTYELYWVIHKGCFYIFVFYQIHPMTFKK